MNTAALKFTHLGKAVASIVAKPAGAVAFDGRRIAWFYTQHRELIELVER